MSCGTAFGGSTVPCALAPHGSAAGCAGIVDFSLGGSGGARAQGDAFMFQDLSSGMDMTPLSPPPRFAPDPSEGLADIDGIAITAESCRFDNDDDNGFEDRDGWVGRAQAATPASSIAGAPGSPIEVCDVDDDAVMGLCAAARAECEGGSCSGGEEESDSPSSPTTVTAEEDHSGVSSGECAAHFHARAVRVSQGLACGGAALSSPTRARAGAGKRGRAAAAGPGSMRPAKKTRKLALGPAATSASGSSAAAAAVDEVGTQAERTVSSKTTGSQPLATTAFRVRLPSKKGGSRKLRQLAQGAAGRKKVHGVQGPAAAAMRARRDCHTTAAAPGVKPPGTTSSGERAARSSSGAHRRPLAAAEAADGAHPRLLLLRARPAAVAAAAVADSDSESDGDVDMGGASRGSSGGQRNDPLVACDACKIQVRAVWWESDLRKQLLCGVKLLHYGRRCVTLWRGRPSGSVQVLRSNMSKHRISDDHVTALRKKGLVVPTSDAERKSTCTCFAAQLQQLLLL